MLKKCQQFSCIRNFYLEVYEFEKCNDERNLLFDAYAKWKTKLYLENVIQFLALFKNINKIANQGKVRSMQYHILNICMWHISRNGQYKNVYSSTIELPYRTRIFKANCCLKVHNVYLMLAMPISG